MPPDDRVTLCLCGDVMLGRGVDQIMAHPSSPELYEDHARSAEEYVALAERVSGPLPRHVDGAYPWGDALAVLDAVRPDARIINLETSITTSDAVEPKAVAYRMHPGNVGAVTAARIDCCVLANNHVGDWGPAGLRETLLTLKAAGVRVAGAGANSDAAHAPAFIPLRGGRRIAVLAFGAPDCGIPAHWAAGEETAGVNRLDDLSEGTVAAIARHVAGETTPGDIVVASLHWGSNWGYDIPRAHRQFAHALIDRAGVDVVHGHSSHHPRAIEVHHGRPILYGCGDFINDYEGISGQEVFRGDLALMYLPSLDARTHHLLELRMVPFRIQRFRLRHPSPGDLDWLVASLDRQCVPFGHHVRPQGDALVLERTNGGVGGSAP